MAVPIFLAQAGSAKPTPTTAFEVCVQNVTSGEPACSDNATPSVFTGNDTATVQLSIINDKASTSSIGSAKIAVPPQLKIVDGTASPSKYVRSDGQTINITGVNLPGGKAFVATFQVDVACGGQFDWATFDSNNVQHEFAAYASTDQSGSSFDYRPSSSAGVSTSIDTMCHLAFTTQPTDSPHATTLWVGGSATGGPIKVGLFHGASGTSSPMTTCPIGYEQGCSVDLGSIDPQKNLNVGITNGGTVAGLTQPLQPDTGGNLVATFSDVEISPPKLPAQFDLTATGDGSFAPTVNSGSFLIADNVTPITCSLGNCSKSQQNLEGFSLTPSFVDVTGVTNFNFMTLTPYTLGTVPNGCTGRKDLGVAGFAESDGRNGTISTLTINFYVNMDNIKARYGANTGQQFIPICVGARPVDSNGTAHDCDDTTVPWTGDGINSTTGKFTGKPALATCNADGYYWGIIGSFQDKIPAGNPVVTSWGGTSVNGTNYRVFTMSVPSGWDYRGGP